MSGYISDIRKLVGHRTLIQCAGSVICVDDKGRLLLGRRTDNHLWGYAGGSAETDEKIEDCAKRELFEETGITASSLTEISRLVFDSTHCLYYHYLCVTGCEKDSIRLQDGETCAYRWASRDEVIAMSDDETVSIRMREYLRNNVSND